MVLQTLNSLGPLHGYAIAARLEQVSSGALQLNMGTLYPALMRLEQRGLLRGTLGMTETTFWPSEAQIARLAGVYGPNKEKGGYVRGGIGFLTHIRYDQARTLASQAESNSLANP